MDSSPSLYHKTVEKLIEKEKRIIETKRKSQENLNTTYKQLLEIRPDDGFSFISIPVGICIKNEPKSNVNRNAVGKKPLKLSTCCENVVQRSIGNWFAFEALQITDEKAAKCSNILVDCMSGALLMRKYADFEKGKFCFIFIRLISCECKKRGKEK